jgi:uncharacterized protein YcbK (DUF882 family)
MYFVMKPLSWPIFFFFALQLGGIPDPSADEAKPQTVKDSPEIASPKAPKRKPKKKVTKKRRCRSYANPRYRRVLAKWRQVPRTPKPKFREGLRDLTIYAVNLGERVRVFPYLPDGKLDPEALTKIGHLFRDRRTGAEGSIHPRLIQLLYRIADRFKARQINIISGYRESVKERIEGNHGRGKAVDFMIPGIKLGAAAYYARTLGYVGVGLYPVSGFIHLDVREKYSYFWVDRSGPGQPSCMIQIHSDFARKMDKKYKPRHDEPRRRKNRRGKLLGARPTPEASPPIKPGTKKKKNVRQKKAKKGAPKG